ncbi:MAG: aminotransferase class I/II-fold pyridoxal phosphate-dependent enzyme, partial [Treponemataceae bacterium]|nr:aminotransferase class I/II-fold pyridoxal phosphate-dependent enzyme [Treponemataceae bacterium]
TDYARCARLIVRERDDFAAFLRARGWFVLPSQTNFVFAKKDGVRAEAAYRAIKAAGILVRHFSAAGIEDFLRITIGTRAQMDALKAVMESL